jgi:hypothetical protein
VVTFKRSLPYRGHFNFRIQSVFLILNKIQA